MTILKRVDTVTPNTDVMCNSPMANSLVIETKHRFSPGHSPSNEGSHEQGTQDDGFKGKTSRIHRNPLLKHLPLPYISRMKSAFPGFGSLVRDPKVARHPPDARKGEIKNTVLR
jgi:hypothetical protein